MSDLDERMSNIDPAVRKFPICGVLHLIAVDLDEHWVEVDVALLDSVIWRECWL